VAALELGRGLVLHAATVATSVPALLSAAGHGDLAAAWAELPACGLPEPAPAAAPWDATPDGPRAPGFEAVMNAPPGLAAPGDLRRRVLAALAGSALDNRLLFPPGHDEIAAAMGATGTDAVVYLIPAGARTAGRALVLTPGGITAIPLPLLTTEPGGCVAAYARAHGAHISAGRGLPGTGGSAGGGAGVGGGAGDAAVHGAMRRWHAALTELCAWAWRAAMEPVLGAVTKVPGQLTRLTLIPFGSLGMVPWHAATGQDAAGRVRYACEQAVFSYAASGRQLVDAAGRDRLPATVRPVFVDPGAGDSARAPWEARSIRDAYYPQGRWLGGQSPDEATAEAVLGWLPGGHSAGASLLHLSCPALSATSPARSQLRLSGDKPLAVDRILRQALLRRAGPAGGLVVLSACVSDLSMRSYDEALTLVTAFAASGAASVVGTRWLVPDVRTMLLMFMFHHYLTAGRPPGDALRLAQVWMLDPDRTIPEEMPEVLAGRVPGEDLRDPAAWAGFIHMGR
jgi:hypothetical protein